MVQNDASSTGMTTYVKGLTALLATHLPSIEVTIIANAANAASWRSHIPERYRMLAVEHGSLRPDSTLRVGARALYEFGVDRRARELRSRLADEVDVVHFTGDRMTPLNVGVPSVLSAFFGNYWALPSDTLFGSRSRHWLAVQSAKESLRRAKSVVVTSIYMRDLLVQQCGVPPTKVLIVPLVAWSSLLHEDEGPAVEQSPADQGLGSYFFFPSAHFPYKNHRRLVSAFGILRRKHPTSARLVLTGKPSRELEAQIVDEGLERHVTLLGFVGEDRLRSLYRNALAVVHPSLYEAGGSSSMFEAMWHGVPVASSKLGSMWELGAEAVRGFDPYSPDDMAKAMQELLDEPALRHELGTRGYDHVRSFTAADAAAGMQAAYQMALSQGQDAGAGL